VPAAGERLATKAVVISVPPTVGDVGAFGSTDVIRA
jgi:hypothetical protein